MVYRILCLRIWRIRDRDMERFCGNFTLRVVNMDLIVEELVGGLLTGEDGVCFTRIGD